MPELKTCFVSTPREMQQISDLNAENLKPGLSPAEQESQGFVMWRYEVSLLEAMHRYARSIICKDGDALAGYALTAPVACAAVHPELKLLLQKIQGLPYDGKPLDQHRYYILGQLCVAKPYRGRGVVEQLYAFHREQFAGSYEMMVLTIATQNQRSVRVHERIGFQEIHLFEDHFGGWKVYVWDWR